jgi:hypothetical protein
MLTPTLMRDLFLLVLTVFALFSCTLAQTRQAANKTEANQTPMGNSLVTGRTVYEDTGLPATRHRVQLVASEFLSRPHARFRIPTAITNENGMFSLRRIAAGEYYVVARPVDERLSSGQIFPFLGQTGDAATDAAKVETFKKEYIRISVDGQHDLVVAWRAADGPSAFAAAMDRASREQASGFTLLPSEQKQLDLRVP